MSTTRRFDHAAIAAFYRTHTRAETCERFGCSARLVQLAGQEASISKTTAFNIVAKETGISPREIKRRVMSALAGEPEIIRNLLDEVA